MASAKPISKTQTGFPEYLDFRHLREEGIRHIQKLSGDVWTDHNEHDPGITILEVLCYALLDLGYRCNLPIQELIASDKSKPAANDQFFTAAEILSNNPLTVNDYRKLLMDIRGVRNAWLEPSNESEVALELNCDAAESENQLVYSTVQPNSTNQLRIYRNKQVVLNGLWRVLLELDPVNPESQGNARCENDQASIARILDSVNKCLHQHRNLCEDFFEISILQDEQIAVCAHLELASSADPEDVLVDLFVRLRAFLSPAIHYYTLEQMLERGRTMEEIFAGRPYRLDNQGLLDSHGFIDTGELELLERRSDIHASDVLREIMSTPGIMAVSKLMLFNYIGDQPQTTGQEWCLPLTNGYRPILAPELCKITLFKDGIPFSPNMKEVMDRYTERLSNAQKARLKPYELDKAIPDGKFHNQLGDYYSIQHDFPSVYGIEEGGIPDSASLLRKAQAMQLKGYLLFFDQLLANYLAQLAHLRDFFALRPEKKGISATYFSGSLQSVPDLNQLIRGGAHDPKGEPITGGPSLYKLKELIAIPCATDVHAGENDYFIFDEPQERDNAIQRILSAFENEEESVGAMLDEACQKYRFTLSVPIDLPNGATSMLMRSAALYESEEIALREGESLTFLGLGTEHYRLINRDQLQEYTFEIFYNPRDYDSTLAELAESPAEARLRRTRFLDHLLARFAEDFSEYALLQFKIGSKREEQEARLVAAKENFLAEYPDISRNRGKGFDYTDRARLWDTDNVTGLEKRVSSLMGIGDWKRRTLSPFEVANKPLAESIKMFDFRGRVIFESKKKYVNTVSAWPEYSSKIIVLAADSGNYRPIDCGSHGMYGFQLVETDDDGCECVIAIHPDTYCCAEDRDDKMVYITELFQADVACPPDDGLGYYGKILSSAVGFHFSLITEITETKTGQTNPETARIYVRGAQVFPAEKDAILAWINFLGQAKDWANYRIAAQPFSQNFMPEVLGADGQTLAFLSEFPLEETKAELTLQQVFNFLSKFHSLGELYRDSSGWTWHVNNEEGAILLENLYSFESREQAVKSLDHALELASCPDNFTKLTLPDGSFGYSLLEKYPAAEDHAAYSITLAQSPLQAGWDESQRDLALQNTIDTAERESTFFRRMLVKNTALRLLANNPEGTTLLRGCDIFLDLPLAEEALMSLLEQATDPENFRISKDDGIEIRLLDTNAKALAVAPLVFYTEQDALEYVEQVVRFARLGQLTMDTENTGKAYNFQLTNADNNPALLGSTWMLDKEEAQAAYYEALYWAKKAENLQPVGDAKKLDFRIELRNDDHKLLAVSTEPFAYEITRDERLEEYKNWYGGSGIPTQVLEQKGEWNFSIFQEDSLALQGVKSFPTESEAAFAFETTLRWACVRAAYRCFKAPDGCRFSFELLDTSTGEVLAMYPGWYETEQECQDAIDALVAFLEKNKLPYTTPEDKTPKWHYELWWESCDERIESVLIGVNEYDSEQDAKDALCAMLKEITTMEATKCEESAGATGGAVTDNSSPAKEAKCQQLADGTFGLALEKDTDKAIHPRSYSTKTMCCCVIADLIKYAGKENWMKAPEMTTAAGSYFRLLKGDGPFAKFVQSFSKPELRDDAWCALLEKLVCGAPEYSFIDLSNCAIAVEDGKYYYRLMCGKTVWWRSCDTFGTYAEAAEAFENQYLTILELASDPENYQSYCQGDEFCYFWLADPTDPQGKRCIARTEKLPPGTDLKEAFMLRLKWARTYPIFQNTSDTYCFRIADPETGDLIWLSALAYPAISEARKAFELFLALWCFEENYKRTDDWKACEFGIELSEAGLVGLSLCTKDAAETGYIESPYFSDIILGNAAIQTVEVGEGKDKKNVNYFEIRSSQNTWWRNIETSDTEGNALNSLQLTYFGIIESSAVLTNYTELEDNLGFYLVLKTPEINGVALSIRSPYFDSEAARTTAKEAVIRWARRYPIVKVKDHEYIFNIYNPDSEVAIWSSSLAYASQKEATDALHHFVALFDFKEYYKACEKSPTLKCGDLEPKKVDIGLLHAKKKEDTEEEPQQEKIQAPDPDWAWQELEACLEGYENGNNGNRLFPHFMPEKDCRWGLRWANDAYRVARAPQVDHTPAARECAKDALFHTILCSCLLKDDCKSKWFIRPESPLCKVYYNCANLELPWRGDFGWLKFGLSDDPCDNDPKLSGYIKATTIIDLMALARAEECYVKVQDSAPNSAFVTLGLMGGQNTLVAIGNEMVANTDWEAAKQKAIQQAWEYPYVRRGNKFGFQLTLEQEILLENARDYDTPFEASQDFCRLMGLLKHKSNYSGAESGDCGPFGIEILDPNMVKALHPATYASRAEAENAAGELRYCLEAEGFHVIEHILLRPKTPGIAPEYYGQVCLGDQPVYVASSPVYNISDRGEIVFDRFSTVLREYKAISKKQYPTLSDNEIIALKQEKAREFNSTLDFDCLDGLVKSMEGLTIKDVCFERLQTEGDTLFEACVDPMDCRDPELTADCIPGADPYSFWATVVIPWWGSRFRNIEFRQFVEKTLRREAPAHVGLRIGWLGARQMTELEIQYRAWLESNALGDDNCARQDALNAFMEIIKNLLNVYPEAKLHDCDSGGDGGAFVLLDRTQLGAD